MPRKGLEQVQEGPTMAPEAPLRPHAGPRGPTRPQAAFKSAPRSPQDAPRRSQDGSRWPQGVPKRVQEASQRPREAPLIPFQMPQEAQGSLQDGPGGRPDFHKLQKTINIKKPQTATGASQEASRTCNQSQQIRVDPCSVRVHALSSAKELLTVCALPVPLLKQVYVGAQNYRTLQCFLHFFTSISSKGSQN